MYCSLQYSRELACFTGSHEIQIFDMRFLLSSGQNHLYQTIEQSVNLFRKWFLRSALPGADTFPGQAAGWAQAVLSWGE